jgi:hypothetical protein
VSWIRGFLAWRDGGDFWAGYFGPPKADLPTWNPKPSQWSDGHARNMAYKYRETITPMYRNRPTFEQFADQWDAQPKGRGGCNCGWCS